MQENIYNIITKITRDTVMLIKGKVGWQTAIKKVVLINKDIKAVKINVFIVKKDETERYYLERNILSIPNIKLELFNNKSIIVNKDDRVFIESNKDTDVDVFCDCVEKSVIINDIDILFTDQHGNNVDDIECSIDVLKNTLNHRLITFEENENYLHITPTHFDIKDTQINAYKNNNNFTLISEYGCIESSDKYTVNLFQPTYKTLDDVSNFSFFKVTMVQEDEIWLYKDVTTEPHGPLITSNDQLGVQTVALDRTYEVQMEELEGWEIQNFQFTSLRNNLYEFIFDLDDELVTTTKVKILKSDYMDDYDALGIRWRIVGETLTLNYTDIVEDLLAGTYTIEIQKLDGFFDTFTDTINVYDHQTTNYVINNELVRKNMAQNKFIFPEQVTLAIDVIRKPILSVSFEPSGISAQWRVLYPFNLKSNWNEHGDEIKLAPDTPYYIEFSEVDKFLKPSNYDILLPKNTVRHKIKVTYDEMLVSNLKINFVIPNKYRRYLSWCLVRPDDTQEVFMVDWNNSIYYDNVLQNNTYQIKIKEVIFGDTIDVPTYDFNTGVLIPNKLLIKEEIIDVILDEDKSIELNLINNPE